LIYADPRTYRDKAKDGERGAGHKYQTMTVLDICRLPVWELAAENCLLAMWWVPTQPLEALRVVEAWGFRLMTMKGFTWNKCYSRQTDKLALGMGHLTRANSEDCLFAVQGNYPPGWMQGSFSHLRPRVWSIRANRISCAKSWCSCWRCTA
jgi:N6-adenosine-specific RNA methylase IME4